jgi:hypothetical protein
MLRVETLGKTHLLPALPILETVVVEIMDRVLQDLQVDQVLLFLQFQQIVIQALQLVHQR